MRKDKQIIQLEGDVKWFSYEKGYGFILLKALDTEFDLFFHITEYRSKQLIKNGDTVSFDMVRGNKGRLGAEAGAGYVAKDVHFIRRANDYRIKTKLVVPIIPRGVVGTIFFLLSFFTITYFELINPEGIITAFIVSLIVGLIAASFVPTYLKDIKDTCLKCGGTGFVTSVTKSHLGFRCSSCGRFWKKRNTEDIEKDNVVKQSK